MEITKCTEEETLIKQMIDGLTAQINELINEKLTQMYNVQDKKRPEYESKFNICVVDDNVIPYKIQHFIHEQIEKELDQGYISRNEIDDFNHEKIVYEIPLERLKSITYIYDPNICPDRVFRMHKLIEEDNEQDKAKWIPYSLNLDNTSSLVINSKYYIQHI